MKTDKIVRVVDEIDRCREEQIEVLNRICDNIYKLIDDLLALSKLIREEILEKNKKEDKKC